jgi:hypothetical protein
VSPSVHTIAQATVTMDVVMEINVELVRNVHQLILAHMDAPLLMVYIQIAVILL